MLYPSNGIILSNKVKGIVDTQNDINASRRIILSYRSQTKMMMYYIIVLHTVPENAKLIYSDGKQTTDGMWVRVGQEGREEGF